MGQVPAIALHMFGIQICMGRKLPSTAGDPNTSSGFKHLGLCHGDLPVASHPAQPNCNGLKQGGDWGKGTAFTENLENKRGKLRVHIFFH